MFKPKLTLLLPLLCLTSCTLETTRETIAYVSRHYLLAFATKNVNGKIELVDLAKNLKTGWSSPTICDFHYDGTYEETLVYSNKDLEPESHSGTYYLKGNTYYITNENNVTITGTDMYPYSTPKCPVAYNIVMGFDHEIILNGVKETVTLWYMGNVFIPYDFGD